MRVLNAWKERGIFSLKNIFQPRLIYHLIRILLSVVFLCSGISKLMRPEEYSVIISGYGLIPDAWILPLAIFLPVIEMVFGLGLLLDIRGSLAVITGLLILFMAILSYGVWLGLDVDCGCFGPEDPEARAFHGLRLALVRDNIMMMCIFYLYYQRVNQDITPGRLRDTRLKLFNTRRTNDANREDCF